MTDGLKDRYRETIIAILAAHPRVDKVVLFGSRAMGTHSVESDIDLAIFGDGLTARDVERLGGQLEETTVPQRVDLVRHAAIESEALKEHIARCGVVWWERGEGMRKQQATYDAWPRCLLRDLVEIVHGWPFRSESFSDDIQRPVVVSIGNFRYTGGFRFDSTQIKRYSGAYPTEFELAAGDILLVMTCQTEGGEILGIPGRIPNDGQTYLHNQRMGKVVIRDRSRLDPSFLYWLFLWTNFNRHLCGTASGTKILHTSPTRIGTFELQLPPLPEQRRIAAVLGALDDKIELNRKMNRTLEAMAQAIFKSWFIDFDGHDPADMVESELGLIPRGWRVGNLSVVADNVREVVQPGDIDGETPYVGLEHVPRRSASLESWGRAAEADSAKGTFRRGDILFGKLRPYFHKVVPASVNGVASTDIIIVRPKQPNWRWFSFGHLFTDEMVAHATASSDGTKMPRTKWADLCRFTFAVPPTDVVDQFDRTASPLFDRLWVNLSHSRTLATLRDTLLPKLISGEIRVPEAKAVAEEAAP